MATKKKMKNSSTPKVEENQEGYNLLGSPTFEKLDNGRFKCIETGHETLLKDKDIYINSKKCRLGLIDFALSNKKPPLNMFKQDPHCKLKLVCKLTGDIVNKSEEHIWKHINGKRFLAKLEQKEEKIAPKKIEEEKVEEKKLKVIDEGVKKDKKKKIKVKKEKSMEIDKDAIREKEPSDDNGSELEELEFWCPSVGSRWDHDDGKDRWRSDSESSEESGDDDDKMEEADGVDGVESGELVTRIKRTSLAVGPSSFASRKKKIKSVTDVVFDD
ncbi:hypothetical protein ACHQM5_008123 [Ranunculus cassubicifolius]